jgi:hypothetical protein
VPRSAGAGGVDRDIQSSKNPGDNGHRAPLTPQISRPGYDSVPPSCFWPRAATTNASSGNGR